MAFVSTYHIPNDERTTDTDGKVTEVWNFLVAVDAITDTASVAEAGVPYAFGDNHPTDGTLGVTGVRTSRSQDEPLIWNVQVTFTTQSDSSEPSDPGDDSDPTIWGVRIAFGAITSNETVFVDRTGIAITNAAGQQFEPAPEKTYYDEQLTVSFKVTEAGMSAVATAINGCRGKINSADVTLDVNGVSRTFPAETLKLITGDYNTTTEEGNTYWEVNYVFVSRKVWARVLLNQGYYTRDGGGQLVLIRDKHNDPVSSPSWLSADGTAVSATANYRTFYVDETAAFAPLFSGFPT